MISIDHRVIRKEAKGRRGHRIFEAIKAKHPGFT